MFGDKFRNFTQIPHVDSTATERKILAKCPKESKLQQNIVNLNKTTFSIIINEVQRYDAEY